MPQMRTRKDRPQVFCAGCAAQAVSPAAVVHSAERALSSAAMCAVCCVLQSLVTVSLRVLEVVLCSAGGPYYLLLSTPTHPDRSDSLNYGWPSSSVADQY